ncbi:MAG: sigma-54-dependent Fis family transcriptional regulator [Alphaproteobacteria bacterium]|nr:sigma-54-dependent Fis family transcriptional regulator [Alphaproteobacteria bacterium]
MSGSKGKKVLIIEDDRVFNQLVSKQLRNLGLNTTGAHSWGEARAFLGENEPALILLDIQLPDASGLEILPELAPQYPVIVLTAFGSVQSAIKAIRGGASEYLMKPVNLDELELTVTRALENAHLREECQFLRSRTQASERSFMIGSSPAILRVAEMIEAVAPADTTVLIQGESGVGKELVAQEVHRRSLRAEQNFVPLDCCTLQENLFESELFGHERGAFTGADRQKKGLIEVADGGTLFLDEIGEISPAIQAKLLRVLETGQFRRLGGTKDLGADVRIVAATNRDLKAMAAEGQFRKDLYYRLSAIVITVPPLSARLDDIPALIQHFIDNHDFSRRIQKRFSPDALTFMQGYGWPGNIRELRNVVERAIILSRDDVEIGTEHLGIDLPAPPRINPKSEAFDDIPTLEEMKERYVRHVYRRCDGHRSKMSEALDVSERNVYRLIEKYGLK